MLSQSTGTLSLTVIQLFFKRVTIHVLFKTLGLNGYSSCCDICCVVMLVWYGKIYCENKENNNSNVKIWLLVGGGLANFDWQASPRHLIWRLLNWDWCNHKKFLFSYLCICECTCTISVRKPLFFVFSSAYVWPWMVSHLLSIILCKSIFVFMSKQMRCVCRCLWLVLNLVNLLLMEIGQFSLWGVLWLFWKRRWRFLLVQAQPVNGACLLLSITELR